MKNLSSSGAFRLPKFCLTMICLLSVAVCASAQGDDFSARFGSFRQSAADRYANFRDKSNGEYADFLRKAWEAYTSVKLDKPEEKPLPPVHFDDLPVVDNPVVIKDTVRRIPVIPRPEPEVPVKPVLTPKTTLYDFDFFGKKITVRADREKMFRLSSTSEDIVADAWDELSSGEFESTLEDMLEAGRSHHCCDWAYLQMVCSFSDAFAGSADESAVLSAWLLCQSGYKVRIARADHGLCVLFASDYTIFGVNRFLVDGVYFYCMDGRASNIEVAAACRFPKERGLSFALDNQPLLGEEYTAGRTLHSEKYPEACVTSSVNVNLIKFLATYPDTQYGDDYMSRWAMYAGAPMSEHCKDRIYPQLKSAIEGKGELEAVNILLNFVQTAFKYEYDDKVWGYDRIFFAEETLYYDYCDCEDRSILFSRLVMDLLGLDVALVYYPNHLATAVKFNADVAGEYFVTDDGRYTICDPTYIGAPAGAVMKGMAGKEANLILLK